MAVQSFTVTASRTLKDLHKHVLRFAIYGRPKAFVTRDEISGYFETFNVQIDSVLKMFAVSSLYRGMVGTKAEIVQIAKHPDVENWEGEYYQAKLDDEAASYEVSRVPLSSVDTDAHICSNCGRFSTTNQILKR